MALICYAWIFTLLITVSVLPWIIWYGIGLKEFPWWFLIIDIILSFLIARVGVQMYDILTDNIEIPTSELSSDVVLVF